MHRNNLVFRFPHCGEKLPAESWRRFKLETALSPLPRTSNRSPSGVELKSRREDADVTQTHAGERRVRREIARGAGFGESASECGPTSRTAIRFQRGCPFKPTPLPAMSRK